MAFRHDTGLKQLSKVIILRYYNVQVVVGARVEAITHSNVAEHTARVESAMKWHQIYEAKRILKMDQSGSSFQKIVGWNLRKGMCMNQNFKLKEQKLD